MHLNVKAEDLSLFTTSNNLRNYSGSIENPNEINKQNFDVLVNDYILNPSSSLPTIEALKMLAPGFEDLMVAAGVSFEKFSFLTNTGINEKQTIEIKLIKDQKSIIVKIHVDFTLVNNNNIQNIRTKFSALNNASVVTEYNRTNYDNAVKKLLTYYVPSLGLKSPKSPGTM
jgi:hypothetical protein